MKATLLLASLAIAAVASAAGQTFLEENFSDSNWEDRWTVSSSKPKEELGKLELASGSFVADKEYAQGLKTSENHRFYQISTPFSSVADNSKDDLIVQYTIKQEVSQECGGSYLKLLPENYDAKNFNGDSEYAIMFGPDVCGPQNRIHVIFNHKGQNYLTKKEFPVSKDTKTHLYRLTVHPDQKYSLMIDGDVLVDHVSLEEHWDIYGPRKVADPEDKKPADWVDEAEIEDKTHVKPENYDDIPRYVADPEAKIPEDWDAESDGDWEAPEIPIPDFEEWEPKMISNPAYKGEWEARQIDNPDYKEDPELAHYKIGGLGLDLWQVVGASIFDDIVVTSDAEVADKYLGQWKTNNVEETRLLEEEDAREKKEREEASEKYKKESEAAAAAEATEKDELDDDEEPVAKQPEVKIEKKEEVKEETKEEIKEEVKEEAKKETKEEVKEEAKKETKEEVKKETKEDAKEEAKETKHDEL